MNTKLISLILFGLILPIVVVADYSEYDYYVQDKVYGKNLMTTEFEDEYGLISNLLYSDMVKQEFNVFRGFFSLGITPDDRWDTVSDGVEFSGKIYFDDNSKVVYEVTNFELVDLYMDEYGVTQAFGNGILTYEATIIIKKQIPIEVEYNFYKDVDYKDQWSQDIYIRGLGKTYPIIELQDDGIDNTYNHFRKCLVGCD